MNIKKKKIQNMFILRTKILDKLIFLQYNIPIFNNNKVPSKL